MRELRHQDQGHSGGAKVKYTGKPIKIRGRWLKPMPVPKRRWAGYGKRRPCFRYTRWAGGLRIKHMMGEYNVDGRFDGLWGCLLRDRYLQVVAK
jgi:hypothetical protein